MSPRPTGVVGQRGRESTGCCGEDEGQGETAVAEEPHGKDRRSPSTEASGSTGSRQPEEIECSLAGPSGVLCLRVGSCTGPLRSGRAVCVSGDGAHHQHGHQHPFCMWPIFWLPFVAPPLFLQHTHWLLPGCRYGPDTMLRGAGTGSCEPSKAGLMLGMAEEGGGEGKLNASLTFRKKVDFSDS